MLVYNLLEKMSGNAQIAIRINGKYPKWFNMDDNELSMYHRCVVKAFHIEPNLEDNGAINWKTPCRIVIDVKNEEPYISENSFETVKMLENWLKN